MILDLEKFVSEEKKYWVELESVLKKMEQTPDLTMSIEEASRFHYLYQRALSNLSEVKSFSGEKKLVHYIEGLVGRAYMQIFDSHHKQTRFSPIKWFFNTFPQTFRKHIQCFWLTLAIFMVGCLLGGGIIAFDPPSKRVIMPFSHLLGKPSERVKMEESVYSSGDEPGHNRKASFSAELMTHNTKVSIYTMVLGMTWGIGTCIMLFYNGVILGGVAIDYILDGQLKFLLGWLLPHGVVEIPAIFLAGQAGLVIALQMLRVKSERSLRERLSSVMPDVGHLICGVAIMLVWAGLVESFFSQYHEPILPYSIKILFGCIELAALCFFFLFSGKRKNPL